MKYFFFSLLVLFSVKGNSQTNIGINKTNPAHPLDISGNMNVDGNILINNTQGQDGQVLSTNASGLTAWANLAGDYKYLVSFVQNSTWTVPATVNKIMIEAWGGGGGGAAGGGGSGGMYILSVQDVTPGSKINVALGHSGAHATCATCNASDGNSTTVDGSFGNITSLGGVGALATAPAYGLVVVTYGHQYTECPGQNGFANTFTYVQKNSTTFATIRNYGDGGAVGPGYKTRSQGQTISFTESTQTPLESNSPSFAPFPGGGGGGGLFGQDGAGGFVVIRY